MTLDIDCEKLKDIEDDTDLYQRCKLLNSNEPVSLLNNPSRKRDVITSNAMNLYNTTETNLNNTVDLLIEAHATQDDELIKTLQYKYSKNKNEILDLINTFEHNINTNSRDVYKSIVLKNSNITNLYNKIEEYKQINNVVIKNSKNIVEKNNKVKNNTIMLGICGGMEILVVIFIFINIYYARK